MVMGIKYKRVMERLINALLVLAVVFFIIAGIGMMRDYSDCNSAGGTAVQGVFGIVCIHQAPSRQ